MLIIPAIDLKDGKCVRLRQGKMDQETVFSDDPIAIARQWVEAGARRLHVVDLDGAVSGKPVHSGIIAEITRSFPDLPVQVGGGVRDEDTVQAYLDSGVQFVILGTRAITQPHFVKDLCLEFPGHIIVGLDVKEDRLATAGWSKISHHQVTDLAQHFETDGVAAIIYTDISRDGMMSGLDVEGTVKLAGAIHIPVIAAGGVSKLEDVEALCKTDEEGVIGVITGRALYEKTLDLKEAQALADRLSAASPDQTPPDA